MTDTQWATEKARKLAKTVIYDGGVDWATDDISYALIEAYQRGERDGMERAAAFLASEAKAIEEDEREKASWNGPDPRGPEARLIAMDIERALLSKATAIRALGADDVKIS